MNTFSKLMITFFGAPLRGQTYLNMIYLLLAFPLGLFYFIFLITGLSLGVGLTIVWVGLVILLGVFAIWYGMLVFERAMTIGLLHEKIPPMAPQTAQGTGIWQQFAAAIRNPVTWKGLLYLLVKFPLGVVSFVVMTVFLSAGLALLLAPAYYTYLPPVIDLTINGSYVNPVWVLDTLQEAVIASVAGIFVLLVGMQVFNGLAWVSGKFARVMLGNFSQGKTAAVEEEAAQTNTNGVTAATQAEPFEPHKQSVQR
jgi:hypothetical protein